MAEVKTQSGYDLEYLFQLTPDLICITGFDGYFKKINPAVSITLGFSEEELLEKPVNHFVHPDDQQKTAKRRSELAQGKSLLNFENRYLTKQGSIVWLSWTSVPIMKDEIVFAIAKNITYKKHLEEYGRISDILGMIAEDHHKKFRMPKPPEFGELQHTQKSSENIQTSEHSQSDQFWLNSFEQAVRTNVGKQELSLKLIAGELAIGQRQLFRRVDHILGITPNKLVRVIRLQLAWEAIASGKYRTIKEISNIAGYSSRSHFSRLFKEVYGIAVSELM